MSERDDKTKILPYPAEALPSVLKSGGYDCMALTVTNLQTELTRAKAEAAAYRRLLQPARDFINGDHYCDDEKENCEICHQEIGECLIEAITKALSSTVGQDLLDQLEAKGERIDELERSLVEQRKHAEHIKKMLWCQSRNVAELGNPQCQMSIRIEELQAELTRAKAEAASRKEALALANSMILSGENHSAGSKAIIDYALSGNAGKDILDQFAAKDERIKELLEVCKEANEGLTRCCKACEDGWTANCGECEIPNTVKKYRLLLPKINRG